MGKAIRAGGDLRALQDDVVAHLRANGGTYLGLPGERARVEVRRAVGRDATALFEVALSTTTRALVVFAKATRPGGTEPADAAPRPQLGVPGDVAVRHEFEFQALQAAFRSLHEQDPRFGALRPIDHVPGLRLIVLEHVRAPTLRRAVERAHRLAPGSRTSTAAAAIRNAGAWLRRFHELELGGERAGRREGRAETVALLDALADAIEPTVADRPGFRRRAEAIAASIDELLPDPLPLGLGHGDFAPRNVFVGPGGRVTPFDMLGKWRLPVYEDLAYFLCAIRTAASQRHTFGLAHSRRQLDEWEDELIGGYAGEVDAQLAAHVRLYEAVVYLDRWAALLARAPTRPGVRTWVRASGARFLEHEFAQVARRAGGT